MRLVISPTMPRLALPSILSWIYRMLWFVEAASASISATTARRIGGRPRCLPRALATFMPAVTRLLISADPSSAKGTWLCLYVLLDIFSRAVVGWTVAHRESAALAEWLIRQTVRKHDVARDRLTLHADRGAAMTAQAVIERLGDLGVTRSHGRPQQSNDNPFSEAQFKTLKDHHDFPERFVRKPPEAPAPPAAVWINPPADPKVS